MSRGKWNWASLGAAALVLLVGSADARIRSVPSSSPTNGQECRQDLSDPGVDGVIRLRARIPAAMLALLLEGTPDEPLLLLRDQDLDEVPAGLAWVAGEEYLEIRPGLPLPSAQYTLDVKARLLGRRSLVRGRSRDFTSSFTVGPDTYPPVLLSTRPLQAQLDVRRRAPVVAVFNESLDPESVVLGETVLVENISVYPPAPVPGRVFLDREGFDLVFRPATALPAGSMVGVRLLGVGNPTHVRDLIGNGLVGDPDDGNEVRFHFSTRLR